MPTCATKLPCLQRLPSSAAEQHRIAITKMPSTQQPNCQRSTRLASSPASCADSTLASQTSDALSTERKSVACVDLTGFRTVGSANLGQGIGRQLGGRRYLYRLQHCLVKARRFSSANSLVRTVFSNYTGLEPRARGWRSIQQWQCSGKNLPISETCRSATAHTAVETKGLEPSTPALQRQCSPN